MKWVENHFKSLWAFLMLTVATLASVVTFTILCFEKELQYLPGTISTAVIFLVEIIVWVSILKKAIENEKE